MVFIKPQSLVYFASLSQAEHGAYFYPTWRIDMAVTLHWPLELDY